jgi:hypothetical protein
MEGQMALVLFTRWCIDPKGRTPVTINPDRVDCIEHWGDAFEAPYGEKFPAAAKVILKGKQEYVVQGTVAEVTHALEGSGSELKALEQRAEKAEADLKNAEETLVWERGQVELAMAEVARLRAALGEGREP